MILNNLRLENYLKWWFAFTQFRQLAVQAEQ